MAFIKNTLFPWLARQNWPDHINSRNEMLQWMQEFHHRFPQRKEDPIHTNNSSRAALEIALLDCLLKRTERSFQDFFPAQRSTLRFGLGIGAFSPPVAGLIAGAGRLLGFRDIKVKLNQKEDWKRVKAVRFGAGKSARIRLDANQAYSLTDGAACERLASLRRWKPICIEEPFREKDHPRINHIRTSTGLRFMADESLLSLQDAETIVQTGSYDALNLRISKLGGILPLIRVLELGRKHGLLLQIGCHVGELAILSRVGQLLAAHYSCIDYLEGGYGTWILKSDIDPKSSKIGFGGKLLVRPALSSFGYNVDTDALRLAA